MWDSGMPTTLLTRCVSIISCIMSSFTIKTLSDCRKAFFTEFYSSLFLLVLRSSPRFLKVAALTWVSLGKSAVKFEFIVDLLKLLYILIMPSLPSRRSRLGRSSKVLTGLKMLFIEDSPLRTRALLFVSVGIWWSSSLLEERPLLLLDPSPGLWL